MRYLKRAWQFMLRRLHTPKPESKAPVGSLNSTLVRSRRKA